MTVTSSHTERMPSLETPQDPTLSDMIDHSLARIEELSDEEIDRQLSHLIICATRAKLPDFVKADKVDELIDAVPIVEELIEKIHDTADHILAEETFDSEEALMVVKDLGVAADITQDKQLLEKTINALEDTQDLHMDTLKRALVIAHDEERMFTDVYRNLKAGRPTIAAALKDAPMSQRPDFRPEDDYDYLSHRHAPLNEAPHGVTMDGYDDLYGDYRPGRYDVQERDFAFTSGPNSHVTQILGRIAAEESNRK